MGQTFKIILLSVIFGVVVWVLDAVFDSLFIYKKPFLDVLLLDVPAYDITARIALSLSYIVFGGWLVANTLEQRRSEIMLRESENKLKRIFNNSGGAIVIIDTKTHTVVDCNEQTCQMLGYNRSKIIGLNEAEIFFKGEIKKFKEVFDRGIKKGQALNLETEVKTKDGKTIPVMVGVDTFRMEDRNVILCLLIDITERRSSETAMRESEERYRRLFSAETDAILLFDAETFDIIDVNDVAVKLYGYSKVEFLKLKIKDISAEPVKTVGSIISMRTGKDKDKITSSYHKKKNGTKFPVEISSGEFTLKGRRTFCAMVRDVSERKQSEDALRESEAKYKTLIKNIPGMVYRENSDGSMEVISGSKEICGYTNKELYGLEEKWFSIVHPDDREKVYQGAFDLTKTQTQITQTYRIIHKNRSIRWVEDRRSSFFSQDGKFMGIDGIVLDITARVEKSQKNNGK